LWRLHRSGVRLYSTPRLHAKLILLDDKLVVGSANASALSASQLYEAAILTDSMTMVSQARAYLYQLTQRAEALGKTRLKELLSIKVRRRPPSAARAPGKRIKAPGRATWIVATVDLDEDAYQNEQESVTRAEKTLKN